MMFGFSMFLSGVVYLIVYISLKLLIRIIEMGYEFRNRDTDQSNISATPTLQLEYFLGRPGLVSCGTCIGNQHEINRRIFNPLECRTGKNRVGTRRNNLPCSAFAQG